MRKVVSVLNRKRCFMLCCPLLVGAKHQENLSDASDRNGLNHSSVASVKSYDFAVASRMWGSKNYLIHTQ